MNGRRKVAARALAGIAVIGALGYGMQPAPHPAFAPAEPFTAAVTVAAGEHDCWRVLYGDDLGVDFDDKGCGRKTYRFEVERYPATAFVSFRRNPTDDVTFTLYDDDDNVIDEGTKVDDGVMIGPTLMVQYQPDAE